jgi:hypothetical protein
LPLIPRGATQFNGLVSVYRDDVNWTFFIDPSESSRNVVDVTATDGMGTACTRTGERILASLGKSARTDKQARQLERN